MKKIVVSILLISIIAICSLALVACNDEKENAHDQEETIETDLSVDLQSDVVFS